MLLTLQLLHCKRCLSVDCAMSNCLTSIAEEKLYMTFILMLSLLYPEAF